MMETETVSCFDMPRNFTTVRTRRAWLEGSFAARSAEGFVLPVVEHGAPAIRPACRHVCVPA